MDSWGAAGTLLLSGVLGLSCASSDKTFLFIDDKMDWSSARNHCRENFVDLASISDSTDLALLSGLAESGDQYAFVGLVKVWRWTLRDTEDQREAEVQFNKFPDKLPNHQCGAIGPSGQWINQMCTKRMRFICFDESRPDRFVMVNSSRSFRQAQTHCIKYHTQLARIRNEAENQLLVSLSNGTMAWIGLEMAWIWSDNSTVTITPLETPGKTLCAVLNVTGDPLSLVGWNCDDTLPFFCNTHAQKKFSVKVSMSAAESGADLSEAAAESLAHLVQSKLKEQGFSKDVKLSWRKRPQKHPPTKPEELPCQMKIEL